MPVTTRHTPVRRGALARIPGPGAHAGPVFLALALTGVIWAALVTGIVVT